MTRNPFSRSLALFLLLFSSRFPQASLMPRSHADSLTHSLASLFPRLPVRHPHTRTHKLSIKKFARTECTSRRSRCTTRLRTLSTRRPPPLLLPPRRWRPRWLLLSSTRRREEDTLTHISSTKTRSTLLSTASCTYCTREGESERARTRCERRERREGKREEGSDRSIHLISGDHPSRGAELRLVFPINKPSIN